MAKTKADDRGRQKTEQKFYQRELARRKRKAVHKSEKAASGASANHGLSLK